MPDSIRQGIRGVGGGIDGVVGGEGPPGEVDVFRDLLLVMIDWQSSRTRRALNAIAREVATALALPGEDGAPPFSETPRLLPLPNGSALLDFATGAVDAASLEPVGELPSRSESALEGDSPGFIAVVHSNRVAEARGELEAFWPPVKVDDAEFGTPGAPRLLVANPLALHFGTLPGEAMPHPVSSTINHLSYNTTLRCLGFLRGVLDLPVLPDRPEAGTFAQYLDDLRTGRRPLPTTLDLPDAVWRLWHFSRRLPSLARQPGRVVLRWYHPFELSNELVGWDFVGERMGIAGSDAGVLVGTDTTMPEAYLWPLPAFVSKPGGRLGEEPTAAGYILTRPVSLYSGQHVVGQGDSGTHSHRVPVSNNLDGYWQGLGGREVVPRRKDTRERHVASIVWLPTRDDDSPPMRMRPLTVDERSALGDALVPAQPAVFRAAPEAGVIRDISIRDLGILVEVGAVHLDPRSADEAPAFLGPLGCVIDFDGVEGGRIERVRIESATRKALDAEGDEAGGAVTAMVGHAVVAFGRSRPTRNCFGRDVWVSCVGRHAVVHFGPLATGNTWWGGELRGGPETPEDSPAFAVVHWASGSVANRVLRGSMEVKTNGTPAFFLMDGTAGTLASMRFEHESLSANGPLLPETEVHIRRSGVGNAVDHLAMRQGTLRDEGTRSILRAWRPATQSDAPHPTPVRGQTHENLLRDTWFVEASGGSTHGPWRVAGEPPVARGGGWVSLRAGPGGQSSLAQTVRSWTHPERPAAEADPDEPPQARSRQSALYTMDAGVPTRRSSERTFVAAVRYRRLDKGDEAKVSLRAGERVVERVLPRSPARGEVIVHVSALGASDVVLTLAVTQGTVEFGSPALLEGSTMSTYPVAPIGFEGGRVYGDLWLPGPTGVRELLPDRAVTLDEEVEVVELVSLTPGAPPEAGLRLQVHARSPSGESRLLWEGLHDAGRTDAYFRASDRPVLSAGDEVVLRATPVGAISNGVRRALRLQLQVNRALRAD